LPAARRATESANHDSEGPRLRLDGWHRDVWRSEAARVLRHAPHRRVHGVAHRNVEPARVVRNARQVDEELALRGLERRLIV